MDERRSKPDLPHNGITHRRIAEYEDGLAVDLGEKAASGREGRNQLLIGNGFESDEGVRGSPIRRV